MFRIFNVWALRSQLKALKSRYEELQDSNLEDLGIMAKLQREINYLQSKITTLETSSD